MEMDLEIYFTHESTFNFNKDSKFILSMLTSMASAKQSAWVRNGKNKNKKDSYFHGVKYRSLKIGIEAYEQVVQIAFTCFFHVNEYLEKYLNLADRIFFGKS
jgi:hypothetical protein